MRMNPAMRRFTAWMACLAILMVSLAPAIAHATTAARETASARTDICTSTGVKSIEAATQQTHKDHSSARHDLHYEDCPFCRIQGDTFGPVPAPIAMPLAATADTPYPEIFYQAPRAHFVWTSARSRAPPRHS